MQDTTTFQFVSVLVQLVARINSVVSVRLSFFLWFLAQMSVFAESKHFSLR